MTTTADNAATPIDKHGIAPTFRWGIGTRRRVLGRLLPPGQPQRHPLRHAVAAPRRARGRSRREPGGLVPVDRATTTARRATTTPAARRYGTFDHMHRFDDGGELHTRAAPRRLRARPARRRRSASAPAPATGQPDCPWRSTPDADTLDDATLLTRGTNNKVQDLKTTYLQTDYSEPLRPRSACSTRCSPASTSRARGSRTTRLTRRRASCSTRTSRARRVGTPNDGASRRRVAAPQVLQPHLRRARRSASTRRTWSQVAPDWKVLGGLRWDRFEGDYMQPGRTADRHRDPRRASRTDSLWSQRFGVLYQPTDTRLVPLLVRHLVQHLGRSLPVRRRRRQHAAREEPQHRARRQARPARRPRLDAARAVPLDQVQRAQPRLADGQPPTDYILSGRAPCRRHRARRRRPHHAGLGGLRVVRLDPDAKIDKAASGVAPAAASASATGPSLTPRHSGTIFTTYQLTPALAPRRRPQRAQHADAEPQPGRHRRAELRDRRPDGRVRGQPAGRVQAEPDQRHRQAVRRLALHAATTSPASRAPCTPR